MQPKYYYIRRYKLIETDIVSKIKVRVAFTEVVFFNSIKTQISLRRHVEGVPMIHPILCIQYILLHMVSKKHWMWLLRPLMIVYISSCWATNYYCIGDT